MCVAGAGPSAPTNQEDGDKRSSFARIVTDSLARMRQAEESRNTPIRINTETPELRGAMEREPTTRLNLRIPRIRTDG